MKRLFCAALALMLLLTACAQTETLPEESPDTDSELNETEEPEPLAEAPLVSGDDPAEAMRAVLTSQASFYDVDAEKAATLYTYLDWAEEGDYEAPSGSRTDFLLGSFCDDGGMQAIVSVNGDHFLCESFLILHWYNGTVYGESSDTFRTFWSFKTDGSYDWSLEGTNYGRSYLAFDGENFAPEVYLWTKPGPNDANGDYTGLYYHDDKEVSEDEFSALYAQELEKPDAVWRTLTAEQVDAALSAAGASVKAEEPTVDDALPVPAVMEADTRALALYREYLAGKRTAQQVSVTDYGDRQEVTFTETAFQPPDVYGADQPQNMVWRADYFTLLDLDGDGVRELILSTTNGSVDMYEVFSCWNGQLFDNGVGGVRSFEDLRTDGTFTGSGGAGSQYLCRAGFREGVMEEEFSHYEADPWPDADGGTLDGKHISEAEWNAIWAAQAGKPAAAWYAFTEENLNIVFTAELRARALYQDFLDGRITASALLINYGVPATESRFLAPNIYSTGSPAGVTVDWTVPRYALLDLDGDGVSELLLTVEENGNQEYVMLTCLDGRLYASEVVYRGFEGPKADGTFGWSNGAADNGFSHARFENGVLADEPFAVCHGSSYTLRIQAASERGDAVTQAQYEAFLDVQLAKPDLIWTEFTAEHIRADVGATPGDRS